MNKKEELDFLYGEFWSIYDDSYCIINKTIIKKLREKKYTSTLTIEKIIKAIYWFNEWFDNRDYTMEIYYLNKYYKNTPLLRVFSKKNTEYDIVNVAIYKDGIGI